MHKNKKLIAIILSICAIIAIIFLGLWINKTFLSKTLIYNTTYSFALGSRRVQIYDNGEVYDDLEIEQPNHKVDYKYVKTLTPEQIEELKIKKDQASPEELSDYVIELVYGVKEFGNTGSY